MDISKQVNLFKFHNISDQEILISYKGPFDKYIIAKLGGKIKMLEDLKTKEGKKIFKIFIELAQNVSFYSAENSKLGEDKNTGVGSLLIGENPDHYIFATGNSVSEKDKTILEEKCKIINSLNREDLRKFKREQRTLLPGTKGGAHIGLVMVALITGRELEVEFVKINEKYYYFTITVSIEKVSDEAKSELLL